MLIMFLEMVNIFVIISNINYPPLRLINVNSTPTTIDAGNVYLSNSIIGTDAYFSSGVTGNVGYFPKITGVDAYFSSITGNVGLFSKSNWC